MMYYVTYFNSISRSSEYVERSLTSSRPDAEMHCYNLNEEYKTAHPRSRYKRYSVSCMSSGNNSYLYEILNDMLTLIETKS